ncbi:hypothetical protein P280DRAFT_329928 [Massarina eburnea CBS 473.64]|uniref:Uncharacterized protein n=1 Tax=Massarina eburnea CBS 473.64 TaxID=1395130 RepID=A0A6A6RZ75_9PLEO|nr:hypothetical protein P280DRAFT_329928 [Massarina eburnea CBS 473.64]
MYLGTLYAESAIRLKTRRGTICAVYVRKGVFWGPAGFPFGSVWCIRLHGDERCVWLLRCKEGLGNQISAYSLFSFFPHAYSGRFVGEVGLSRFHHEILSSSHPYDTTPPSPLDAIPHPFFYFCISSTSSHFPNHPPAAIPFPSLPTSFGKVIESHLSDMCNRIHRTLRRSSILIRTNHGKCEKYSLFPLLPACDPLSISIPYHPRLTLRNNNTTRCRVTLGHVTTTIKPSYPIVSGATFVKSGSNSCSPSTSAPTHNPSSSTRWRPSRRDVMITQRSGSLREALPCSCRS